MGPLEGSRGKGTKGEAQSVRFTFVVKENKQSDKKKEREAFYEPRNMDAELRVMYRLLFVLVDT